MYTGISLSGRTFAQMYFSRLWFHKAGQARVKTNLEIEVNRHTDRDAFWAEHAAPIEKIEAQMLVCASFSDHSLHGTRRRGLPASGVRAEMDLRASLRQMEHVLQSGRDRDPPSLFRPFP